MHFMAGVWPFGFAGPTLADVHLGVQQPEFRGMQHQPGRACRDRRRGVQRITPDGMAYGFEMNPQLVRSAGLRLQQQQRARQMGMVLDAPPQGDAGFAQGVNDVQGAVGPIQQDG